MQFYFACNFPPSMLKYSSQPRDFNGVPATAQAVPCTLFGH